MKRFRTRIALGLAVASLAVAAVQVWPPHRGETEMVTIRFAHWQLEAGVRDAFDQVAADYMARNPGVRVVQMTVPDRIYPAWLTTQLSGGTPPDLVQLGRYASEDAGYEMLARHFVPLTGHTAAPNPYNHDSSLRDSPWRSTFLDNLSGWTTWCEPLQEVYGIPTTIFSIRVFYNQELYREITGLDVPPQTLESFLAVCEQVFEYAKAKDLRLMPIAGSEFNVQRLIETFFKYPTQRWRVSYDPFRTHGLSPLSRDEGLLQFSTGQLSMADSPFRDGFALIHQIGEHLGGSVLGMSRDDAALRFLQGKAVMIISGTWDSSGLASQASFPVGAFPLPTPSPHHKQFGGLIYGPQSEAGYTGSGTFGVTRTSKHQQTAIDFLRYLTSFEGAATFSRLSRWPSALTEAEIPPDMRVFAPQLDGYPEGWTPMLEGADLRRGFHTHRHLLFNANGGIETFLARFAPVAALAARTDLERALMDRTRGQRRLDAVFLSKWIQSENDPDAARRFSDLSETQLLNDLRNRRLHFRLPAMESQKQ